MEKEMSYDDEKTRELFPHHDDVISYDVVMILAVLAMILGAFILVMELIWTK